MIPLIRSRAVTYRISFLRKDLFCLYARVIWSGLASNISTTGARIGVCFRSKKKSIGTCRFHSAAFSLRLIVQCQATVSGKQTSDGVIHKDFRPMMICVLYVYCVLSTYLFALQSLWGEKKLDKIIQTKTNIKHQNHVKS